MLLTGIRGTRSSGKSVDPRRGSGSSPLNRPGAEHSREGEPRLLAHVGARFAVVARRALRIAIAVLVVFAAMAVRPALGAFGTALFGRALEISVTCLGALASSGAEGGMALGAC